MSAYELRIYTVADGAMRKLQDLFRELITPLMPEYGITEVGFWSAADDSTMYWIVRHETLKSIGPDWDRFHADPRWTEGLTAREQGVPFVTNVASVPLVGIPGLPPHRDETNRQSVVDFVRDLFEEKDLSAGDRYCRPDMIQHNPAVADGVEADKEYAGGLFASHPDASVELKRVVAADDHVVTHGVLRTGPDDRGTAVVDIFRLDRGRIAEHWDVMQPIPPETTSGHPMA